MSSPLDGISSATWLRIFADLSEAEKIETLAIGLALSEYDRDKITEWVNDTTFQHLPHLMFGLSVAAEFVKRIMQQDLGGDRGAVAALNDVAHRIRIMAEEEVDKYPGPLTSDDDTENTKGE